MESMPLQINIWNLVDNTMLTFPTPIHEHVTLMPSKWTKCLKCCMFYVQHLFLEK